ncbi:hypothetical protein VM1G_07376 [Cytospora mali]|uniref:Uncharacterized protein n=1 Tax=Cytospora mali TaxID=578113 RepID=A0A194W4C7_CYTMA|nr:hypothetical protein VM1G_07376 [Valsa mali]
MGTLLQWLEFSSPREEDGDISPPLLNIIGQDPNLAVAFAIDVFGKTFVDVTQILEIAIEHLWRTTANKVSNVLIVSNQVVLGDRHLICSCRAWASVASLSSLPWRLWPVEKIIITGDVFQT